MSNSSSRHHYLPMFYLKGFTNNDGKYFVFDKKLNQIKGYMSPRQTFFGWDRNTSEIENYNTKEIVRTDMVESELYSVIDSKDATYLKKITDTDQQSHRSLDPENFSWLIHFANSLFWRIPKTDLEVDRLFKYLSPQELGFQMVDEAGRRNDEAANFLQGLEIFRKTYRLAIPQLQFERFDWQKNTRTVNIAYVEGSNCPFLCSDRPIISEHTGLINILHHSFIFPISRDKIGLYMNHNGRVKEIRSEIREKIDSLIYQEADQIICCGNKEYLEYISKISKGVNSSLLRREIFLEFQ